MVLFVFKLAPLPPQWSNEAELMYEASRVARGLPLYTDPIRGVIDDGPLPIRHYVLYGPLAPWLFSLVGEGHRLLITRYVSVAAWFIGVPAVAWRAKGDARTTALIVAVAYAGLFLIARDVVFFTLTPLPVLAATFGLARVVRRGRLDAVASALFVLAWALKPLVMGIAFGVGVFTLLDRETALKTRAIAIAVLTAILAGAVALLMLSTGGGWLVHLRASTDNGMLPQRWLHYTYEYFPVLGLPHLAVAAWLLKAKEARTKAAAWALLSSTVWAIFAMGKRGANAGYFMEPCAALVVALAYGMPDATASAANAKARLLAKIGNAAVLLAPALSLAQSFAMMREYAAKDAARDWETLRRVHDACESAAPGASIRAGLPTMEFPLSGRVTLSPWQQVLLVNAGHFPLETMIADLDRPELGCLVHTRSLEGDPPEEIGPRGELTAFDVLFDVKLREPIRTRFEEFAVIEGQHLFRRKSMPAKAR